MKFTELHKKSAADLQKMLAEKREELRELRFKLAANQVKKVRDVRTIKRDIARIMTRLNQQAEPQVE